MSITTVTQDNFESQVMESSIPVLIDFWASWCAPCRMLSSTIDEIAAENAGKIKVCKVNVDEQQELAARFNVMSIPMLVAIKGGKIVNTSVGVRPKADILRML